MKMLAALLIVLHEQVAAACGEAKAAGLRTWVHAHSPSAIRAAVNGGCTVVTHGSQATLPSSS
jgi:imidazolonepropionase-like amidohydrolase